MYSSQNNAFKGNNHIEDVDETNESIKSAVLMIKNFINMERDNFEMEDVDINNEKVDLYINCSRYMKALKTL